MPSEDKIYLLPRNFMARVVYLWLLAMFLYFFIHNSLVYQWHQPPLIYPQADNVYWLLHILNIPQFILGSPIASICFDIVMIGSCILFLLYPEKVIYCILSVISFWLYQIMFGTSAGHHYAHVGFLIIPIPFIFRNRLKFTFTWQLIRYWILFLYSCAGIYKFYYGGFFYISNMTALLREYVDKGNWYSSLILYLVYHPGISQLFYQIATILETFCIIGFLTTKFDKWIGFGLFIFHLGIFILKGFPFWENSFVIAPFLPWQKMQIWFNYKFLPVFKKSSLQH